MPKKLKGKQTVEVQDGPVKKAAKRLKGKQIVEVQDCDCFSAVFVPGEAQDEVMPDHRLTQGAVKAYTGWLGVP